MTIKMISNWRSENLDGPIIFMTCLMKACFHSALRIFSISLLPGKGLKRDFSDLSIINYPLKTITKRGLNGKLYRLIHWDNDHII